MTERQHNRRGNYSLLMGFSVIGILGFGALGVDISYIAMSNTQAQAVSDAASHAALLTFRGSSNPSEPGRMAEGQNAAQWVVDNNDVGFGSPGELQSLQYGVFNSSSGNFQSGATPPNSARAQVTRTGSNALQLMLAPIINHNTASVDQEGITVANPREIMVVIDQSCSMANGSPLSGMAGTDLALEAFSQYMVSRQVPLDRIGATSFSQYGYWFDYLRYIDGNESAILTRWSQWDQQSPIGCTNQAAGMYPAINALIGSGNDLAFKAIIVISDGNPWGCGTANGFRGAANYAWANGIHVWTVSFGSNINHNLMQQVTKGLGTYERTPNSSGLAAIMVKIAESIPVALVE